MKTTSLVVAGNAVVGLSQVHLVSQLQVQELTTKTTFEHWTGVEGIPHRMIS